METCGLAEPANTPRAEQSKRLLSSYKGSRDLKAPTGQEDLSVATSLKINSGELSAGLPTTAHTFQRHYAHALPPIEVGDPIGLIRLTEAGKEKLAELRRTLA